MLRAPSPAEQESLKSPNVDAIQEPGIDLRKFLQTFFDEADRHLQTLRRILRNLNMAHVDDHALNTIFRCAHSIKGGAATFGFSDVAELTRQMEPLLERLRRRELAPNTATVELLLSAGDTLKAQLARHQGNEAKAIDTSELLAKIRALAIGTAQPQTQAPETPPWFR